MAKNMLYLIVKGCKLSREICESIKGGKNV